MPNKKTLLIDFDGTLAIYIGWQGVDHVGEPLPKARKACILLAREYKLVCFTARNNTALVERWLRQHGFPPMEVTNIKKPAHLTIDDRAICFRGDWNDELLEQIKNFRPHWKEKEDSAAPQSSNDIPSPLDKEGH